MEPTNMMRVEGLHKSFTLHNQGGVVLPVLRDVNPSIGPGECVVLNGPSGSGKSSLLRSMYANYKPQLGRVEVRHGDTWVDILSAEPRVVLDVRRRTLGYVSQFLRVIPRVPALQIVAEPLQRTGVEASEARERAAGLLARLNIPERLWKLAPATFSGGEQQRINIARGFIVGYPILLLDEPTASLDSRNRAVVIELIEEVKARGTAIVGIFHDEDVRERVGTHLFNVAGAEQRHAH
jgi:alpha-D-ribose 1-methylphosphonate 5-triphosphate synthase subunit PhnL